MAAHGGAVVEIARDGGTWKVVDSKYGRRISANTPIRRVRPGGRPRQAQDLGRSDRPQGARHAEQLRRRLDAVGHLADGRGELQRLLRRRCREDARCQGLQALRRVEGHLVCLVAAHRPLQRREGAERAQPLRLDRRDRSLRSRLDAGQAHRARPLQARGLHLRHRQGRPRGVLQRRRRALRLCLQVHHRAAVEPQRPRRQQGPDGRGHALRRPLRPTTARSSGCRWSMARAR